MFTFKGDTERQWGSTPSSHRTYELNGTNSTISTPSTISPAPGSTFEEDGPTKSIFSNDHENKIAKELNG